MLMFVITTLKHLHIYAFYPSSFHVFFLCCTRCIISRTKTFCNYIYVYIIIKQSIYILLTNIFIARYSNYVTFKIHTQYLLFVQFSFVKIFSSYNLKCMEEQAINTTNFNYIYVHSFSTKIQTYLLYICFNHYNLKI